MYYYYNMLYFRPLSVFCQLWAWAQSAHCALCLKFLNHCCRATVRHPNQATTSGCLRGVAMCHTQYCRINGIHDNNHTETWRTADTVCGTEVSQDLWRGPTMDHTRVTTGTQPTAHRGDRGVSNMAHGRLD